MINGSSTDLPIIGPAPVLLKDLQSRLFAIPICTSKGTVFSLVHPPYAAKYSFLNFVTEKGYIPNSSNSPIFPRLITGLSEIASNS